MIKRELTRIIKNFEQTNKKFDGFYSTEVCDFVMMNTFTHISGPSKNILLDQLQPIYSDDEDSDLDSDDSVS